MNIDWEVKVLWELGRNDPSEPQGDDRERITEGSGLARRGGDPQTPLTIDKVEGSDVLRQFHRRNLPSYRRGS